MAAETTPNREWNEAAPHSLFDQRRIGGAAFARGRDIEQDDLVGRGRAAQLAEQLTQHCPGPRNKMWLAKRYGASAGVPRAA